MNGAQKARATFNAVSQNSEDTSIPIVMPRPAASGSVLFRIDSPNKSTHVRGFSLFDQRVLRPLILHII